MLVVTLVLAIGFVRLYKNQKPYLDYVAELQEDGKSMNLDKDCDASQLADLLLEENILTDKDDASATASHIVSCINAIKGRKLRNLGALNSSANSLPVAFVDSAGGRNLKHRAHISRELVGINAEYLNYLHSQNDSSFFSENDSAACHIIAKVYDCNGKNTIQNVPVRLKRHFYIEGEEDLLPADSTIAYVKTDSDGIAEFFVEEGYYSIVPVLEGFEYGSSRGTTSEALSSGKHTYSFRQKEHRIPIFSNKEYQEIKQGSVLTARTPETYLNNLKFYAFFMAGAWWLAFLLSGILGRKRRNYGDMLFYPIIMLITGIGTLSLIGAGNPVLDRPLGFEMIQASLLGLMLMCSLSVLPVSRIYVSGFQTSLFRLPFDPLSNKYKGISYLGIALILIVLLAFFGTSPEGSTAKINLFILQPSELCKFLIVIFMAAFFAENASALRKFSDEANKVSVPIQIRTTAIVATGIVIVSLLYMGVLSDMGPALVLLISFVFMYSLARGDFGHLIFGVLSFLSVVIMAKQIWGSPRIIGLCAVLWFVLWIGLYYLIRKRIYESAIFMNLLFVLFVSGGPILGAFGFEHQAERLESRISMTWKGIWDNSNMLGGDQVAEAIWGYSTGGFDGQGLGLGNENLIPAYHTDLIMATIGEQMGWKTLIIITILMGILLYRAIRAGRKSGHPFSFYLAFGIGIVTVIQFMTVSLGSVGVVPLTGIAVPFLSYAKTSIVLNLAAFGIVIAISRERAGLYQEEDIKKYNEPLISSCISYSVLGLLLAVVLSVYMIFDRNDTLIRTGLFANTAGIRSYVYNPRIQVLIDKLQMETIYDRNGQILSTSDREKALEKCDSLRDMFGINLAEDYRSHSRLKRYYPFGMHTFFMTGDFNDKIQWNTSVSNPYGFNAENRYLAQLRGFDNLKRDSSGKPLIHDIPVPAYKPSRFLPAFKRNEDYRIAKYDYSDLLDMLKDGVSGHREIKEIERKEAVPVTLTIDAVLQARLQTELADYAARVESLKDNRKLRISVVVLKAATGDLLCSSNYPLPQKEVLDSIERNNVYVYNEKDPHKKAYTDRDLGLSYQTHPGSTAKIMTSLAAFKKCGSDVSLMTYDVDYAEIIENGKVKEPFSSINRRRIGKNVSMTEAIIQSSNCYFVNLLNDKQLYKELGEVYAVVGARLDGHEGRSNVTPYYFYDSEFVSRKAFDEEAQYLAKEGLKLYSDYETNYRPEGNFKKFSRFKGSADYWGIAYGQGQLYASPLNMARVASIVANDGYFVSTRYELGEAVRKTKLIESGIAELKSDMQMEADKHRRNGICLPGKDDPNRMISKTGTPERTLIYVADDGSVVECKPNDGWYICSIYSHHESSPLAVAVRMERLGSVGSSAAVQLTADVVLPVLQECGYKIY